MNEHFPILSDSSRTFTTGQSKSNGSTIRSNGSTYVRPEGRTPSEHLLIVQLSELLSDRHAEVR